MNYNDVKSSQSWINQMNKSYINSLGPVVLVYKLNRADTKLNSIYNEEVNGRNYLRPFEIHALHSVGQFDFLFQDNLGTENEQVKSFDFNFEDMVKKISTLKEKPLCSFKVGIFDLPSTTKCYIKKVDNILYITEVDKEKYENNKTLEIDLNYYDCITDLVNKIKSEGYIAEVDSGEDDLSECIPNFNEIDITGSNVLISTFNREYKNSTDVINEGDLIYLEDQNRLYEITSAVPSGNMGWKYSTWNVKCSLTKAYVKREDLKKYKYGLGAFN